MITHQNPYSPPTDESITQTPRKLCGPARSNNCPHCSASIDRWKIGNSIGTARCSDCHAKLWMEFNGIWLAMMVTLWISFAVVFYVLPKYAHINLVSPSNATALQCIVGLFAWIGVAYLRIVLGYPVAKRDLSR